MIAAMAEIDAELKGRQRDFFRRVWATDPEIYRTRLLALGFQGMETVLDGGCGFGQWTLPLARLNQRVAALDLDPLRLRVAAKMLDETGINNVDFFQAGIDNLPFEKDTFEGIFCYSVIYLSDYRKTLQEFSRVLKPGGLLYFSTNGLGWYIHNLLEKHNPSDDYCPRTMAIEALVNTLDYFRSGHTNPGKSLVMLREDVLSCIKDAGLSLIACAGDGEITLDSEIKPKSFYAASVLGQDNVYEVLCRK